ncbi:MAG: peptidase M15 [Deltaproteobacteria bacterium]|nr:peptidase M15 [Deltaproteobacteria bacterium]
MNLSLNFTLYEFTHTDTGLANDPPDAAIDRLSLLALSLLQPIRDYWGPLRITSGYRNPAVNQAAGGYPTSQHALGEAADFVPLNADMDVVFDWLVKMSGLKFGQCISENKKRRRWIHISLPRKGKPNQQALIYDGKEYRPYV